MRFIICYLTIIIIAILCIGCGSSKKNAIKTDIKVNADISQIDTTKRGYSENTKIDNSKYVTDKANVDLTKIHVEYNDSGKIKSVTWFNLKKSTKTESEERNILQSEIKDTLSYVSNNKIVLTTRTKTETKEEQKYSMGNLDAWIGIILLGVAIVGVFLSKYKS